MNLFSEEEISFFRKIYQENRFKHLTHKKILHSTADTANYDLILKVYQAVSPIIIEKLNKVFKEYDILTSGYLTKLPGDKSATGYHQDPTLVDEEIAETGNLWIPLQNVTAANGQLIVVPGSHRLVKNLRATPNCPLYYNAYKDRLGKYSVPIPLKIGQAVFFNHRLIHGSTNNMTETERVALVTAAKSSRSLPWDFYFIDEQKSKNLLEHYHLTFDSFAKLIKDQRPVEAEYVDTISCQFEQMPWKDFVKFMHKEYAKATYWELIKAKIEYAFGTKI